MQALKQHKSQLRDWYDLWFDEYKKAGYVAVTNFEKQLFYGANDVQKIIERTAGKGKQFISINAFDVDWEEKHFSRETESLKQIRNIAIDIDQYKLNLTINETMDEIQSLVASNKIPEPNLILTSRGIQLFYSIDRGASPSMAWLAEYITSQLINKLQHIGADSNAKDMSRVMRVPNSINERNGAIVNPTIWNDVAYSLQELQSYCKPLESFNRRGKVKGKVIYLPLHKGLEQHHKTNHARTADFKKLIELRNGDFTHNRNVFLYMYSYHEAMKHDTQKELIAYMQTAFKDVYSTIDKPMSKSEFITTVKSAHKDAGEFFEHYKANGYQVIYKNLDGIKKPYKTSNIIEKLNITKDEQYSMRSLTTPEIARKQHADYMKRKRIADGTHKGTRAEYEAHRQQQKNDKLSRLSELIKQYPSITKVELASELNISRNHLYRLLKKV